MQHSTVYPFKAVSGMGREEGSYEDEVRQGIRQMHPSYRVKLSQKERNKYHMVTHIYGI